MSTNSAISEWAPQPWSAETTRASSEEYTFAQAPKATRIEPASGRKNPQVPHLAEAGADSLMGPAAPVALVPALRGLGPAVAVEHPLAPQPQLVGDVLDSVVLGVLVGGHEAVVLGFGRQDLADADLPGLEAIGPRHPRRRQQRLRARQQRRLGDRGDARAGARVSTTAHRQPR
ncbi:hypothetical protein GCM10029992_16380 [Glycomyces albus]